MKKNEIKVGEIYTAKVSDKIVSVRIDQENPRGGWSATNLSTGKVIRIKSAQRLRAKVRGKKAGHEPEIIIEEAVPTQPAEKKARTKKAKNENKPKRTSAIDAAAEVLKSGGQPLRAKEMIAAMSEKGLWTSPGGKTPEATLYSAILREISTKGAQSRFRRIDRGQFAHA